jgi:DUF1680 family protein
MIKINNLKIVFLFIALAFLAFKGIFVSAQSLYPGQRYEKLKVNIQVPVKAYSFDLKNIRLLDSPFKENMQRESKWLLSLTTDQLLYTFRLYAGMDVPQPKIILGGWEAYNVELRGHTTGHVMSALSLMYASTGDEIYKLKGDSLVRGLAEVQKILNRGGYLSAFPEYLIDRVITGKPVWAPWYTLHKILAGLEDMYLYANNIEALEVAKRMASWAYNKLSPLSEQQLSIMHKNEFGGIGETFYNLYSITGDRCYLELARMFYHPEIFAPLIEGKDKLAGQHGNTFVPKIIAEARAFELTGEEIHKIIATNFWNIVVSHHSYVTGGNDDKEHFFDPDCQVDHLTGYTSETCNVYNMLKLTRHLFTWTADEKYADFYERALYNHILGSQDSQSGMVCYFMPLEAGAYKLYSTSTQSFWCCVGTWFENHAKYGEGIYYYNDEGLFVNLFIPSELNWDAKGVSLQQLTRFPEDGNTILKFKCKKPINFSMYLRYPKWATDVSVKINGQKVKITSKPGNYITLSRQWVTGDQVEINYQMKIRMVTTSSKLDVAALMYGPIVLAAPMGTKGMLPPAPFSNPTVHNDYYNYNYNIPNDLKNVLSIDKRNIDNEITPVVGEKLKFRSKKDKILLEPLYRIHHQRYIVYWNIID